MDSNLSYNCEDDKCYGATGMAISIMVYDSDELLSSISLDAPAHSMVDLIDDFYFSGNPGLSAKSAWNQILRSFNLTMAMTIGNVMCRTMVRDRKAIDDDLRRRLLEIVTTEGLDTCSLEEDECRSLFAKNYNYLYRVFNHQGVHDVAHDFADRLKRARHMTRLEVVEQLRGLRVL